MQLIAFLTASSLVFAVGDLFMIPLVMRPLFKAALGDTMLDTLRLGPAAAFYAIHLAGLAWFAGRPAATGGSAASAFVDGAVLGLVAYSCYEMTSWTIMRDWTATLVVVDTVWGAVISGIAAYAGALAARRLTAPPPGPPPPPPPSC
jgi:uncharacterized membrane protein